MLLSINQSGDSLAIQLNYSISTECQNVKQFHPAGSLSFQLLPTLSSGEICQYTLSLVENCCRTAWARVPCHRQRNNPEKPEKGAQVLRPVPDKRKITVKNSDSSHRLALNLEHSRMFRFQGDLLLMSLYLLMLQNKRAIKRNNKVGKRWRQPVEFLP